MILPPLLADDGGEVQAAPTPTYSAMALDPVKPYPPVTGFYQQAGPRVGSPQTAVAPYFLPLPSDGLRHWPG